MKLPGSRQLRILPDEICHPGMTFPGEIVCECVGWNPWMGKWFHQPSFCYSSVPMRDQRVREKKWVTTEL